MESRDIEGILHQVLGGGKDISKITIGKAESGNIVDLASSPTSVKIEFLDHCKPALHLFMKACIKGSTGDTLNKEFKLFDRELFFYADVLPVYSKILMESSEEKNMFVTFYGLGKTKNGMCLVLEDFMVKNYGVTGRKEFHSFDLIKTVMKNVAVFHASYFHVKDDLKCKWGKYLDEIQLLPSYRQSFEKLFVGQFKKVFRVIRIVSEEVSSNNQILSKHGVKPVSSHLLTTVLSFMDKIVNVFFKIVTRKNKFSCLCHGDFHMWNIAFDENSKEDVKFFDYQALRSSSLVTDILQYLYHGSTPEFRQKHLAEILEIYCTEFNNFCSKTGIDKHLDKEELFKEYECVSILGFMYAFTFILRRFLALDFFQCLENVSDGNEVVSLLNEKAIGDEIWGILNLYHDLIKEAEEMGSFDLAMTIHS